MIKPTEEGGERRGVEAERKRENQRLIGFIDGFNGGSDPMGVGGSSSDDVIMIIFIAVAAAAERG